MNLRDLKYLVALAEHRHFRKASEACFVSQPALSMQIKKLEEHLGVQLLERTNKSVLLTEIGVTLSARARTILVHADEMHKIAQSAKDPYSGELKLGIFPTLASYLLPHIMPKISAMFPKIAFYLIEEKTDILVESLKCGKLDAAILALPLSEPDFLPIPLFEEDFLLAVSPAHPFAKRKTIDPLNLKDQSLLLLDEGHCMRGQTLNVCANVRAIENKCFRATSLETLRHIVATGLGITLMPALAMKPKDIVSYIAFQMPKPVRTIGFCVRTTTAKKILFTELVMHIKKALCTEKHIPIL
jgi:LysR family hydrogen peroxide-inducible transcriptional activator